MTARIPSSLKWLVVKRARLLGDCGNMPPMRIALISDIHGNLAALEAVVADIKNRAVDQIVNLGDSLSGPLLPLETAQYLIASGWLCLAGNHERQILTQDRNKRSLSDEYAHSQLTAAEFEWLESLAPTAQLSSDVFLCHGTPASDVEYFLDTVENGGVRLATSLEIEERLHGERSKVIACGHTHIPHALRSNDGQLLINPGSVGLPAYDDVHPELHIVETGSPDARYAVIEKSNGEWRASLVSISYDFKSMARLAKIRGREDWEHALLTGRMPLERRTCSRY